MNETLPLAGIKVVELGQNVAGPYAGLILASLGADVVKIERPVGGDDARGWSPVLATGSSSTFEAMNRGKKSVALDLNDAEAMKRLRAQIADCDVLLHNLRPGVMEQLGLGAERLTNDNPRLVYCNLTAFGHMGSLQSKPGYEPIVQAFAGIFSINGPEDGPGVRVGLQILDLGTGIWGALGCLAALFRRTLTGRGGIVDASLLETALGWLQLPLANFNATGKHPVRQSSGSANVVVFQAFDARDGAILIAAANDRLYAKLCRAIGQDALADDPRFATNADRVKNRELIIPAIEKTIARQPVQHWVDVLEAAGVPCSPIHDLKQMLEHPHVGELGIMQHVPGVGLDVVGLPFSIDRRRPELFTQAPRLGEHSDLMRD